MNFLRRATIVLVTSIVSLGGVALAASPADAARDTGRLITARDTGWP